MIARWLAPSVVAACAGALVAGALEGRAAPDTLASIASAGFVALLAIPVLLASSLAARALVAAWRPHALGEQLREDGGGMPRLAGWVAMLGLGALALAWTTFQGTWLLAAWTAFKPLAVGFAQPVIAVVTVLALGALSRPTVRMFAAIARAIDRRWQARGHGTLLAPRTILAVAGLVTAVAGYVIWRVLVRPRVAFDPGVLHAPVLGVVTAWLVHVAWRRRERARAVVGLAIVALAAGAIASAIVTVSSRPGVTIAIWSARPIARLSIERYFDLDAIRDRVPLDDIAPVSRPAATHPDLVIVTLAGVRADRTPIYGGPADMPALRQLAERGAVFDHAFASSTTPERALPAILTGTAANRLRGDSSRGRLRLDPRHVLLAERFRAAGYETAAFVCCPALWSRAARTGLHRGFAHLVVEPDETRLGEAATRWLAERRRRAHAGEPLPPLLLWIHLDGARAWAPPELPAALAAREHIYDRALGAVDRVVADVLGEDGPRAPIVVLTSERGEALGDHEQVGHGAALRNGMIRVPLVIAGPGIQRGRVHDTVSVVDLVPTVLDLAGYAPPADRSLDGRSFAALARGVRSPQVRGGIAFTTTPALGPGERLRADPPGAVIEGPWKLIEDGPTVELYNLDTDPHERANHATVRPEVMRKLRKLLDQHRARARVSPF